MIGLIKNRLPYAAVLVVAVCGLAFAQDDSAPKKKSFGNLADDNQAIQIEAKTLTVLQQEHKIIFETNVVFKRGPTVIHCNKLTAYYHSKTWEVRKAVCRGSVKITHKDTYARCGKATFDNVKQIITMESNPVIYQGEQVFRGDVLRYYLQSEKITGTNIRFQRNPKPPPRAPKANP